MTDRSHAPDDKLLSDEVSHATEMSLGRSSPSRGKGGAGWFVRQLREPLLHFLLLAACILAVDWLISEPAATEIPDSIVVTQQRIDSLIQTFTRTWQRPPSAEELRGLVNNFVKEEVLYREALKMGLDRDDTLIRRRMRQKLEFLAEEFADAVEPTDEELQQFLNQHSDSYRTEGQFTFRQVFLSPDRRGPSLAADAASLLRQLQAGEEGTPPEELGDPTLLPHECTDLRESQVRNQFGEGFAAELTTLEVGKWSGPVDSAYGRHLVLLINVTPGRAADLTDARDQVRRDWVAARRAESQQQFFERLLKNYQITIEPVEVTDQASNPPQ